MYPQVPPTPPPPTLPLQPQAPLQPPPPLRLPLQPQAPLQPPPPLPLKVMQLRWQLPGRKRRETEVRYGHATLLLCLCIHLSCEPESSTGLTSQAPNKDVAAPTFVDVDR